METVIKAAVDQFVAKLVAVVEAEIKKRALAFFTGVVIGMKKSTPKPAEHVSGEWINKIIQETPRRDPRRRRRRDRYGVLSRVERRRAREEQRKKWREAKAKRRAKLVKK